jgi:preprotein translocase subunit SecY
MRDKKTLKKLLFTMMALFAILVGYQIPLPGINPLYLQAVLSGFSETGLGSFINLMTGNSMQRMSIFALSVGPYITASIIIQLLSVVFPKLQALQRDGNIGRKKIERLTYLVGGIFAVIEALGLALSFGKGGLITPYSWYMVLYATVVWAGGALLLICLGQTITNKLMGNGISLIFLFNILLSFPTSMVGIFTSIAGSSELWVKIVTILGMIVVFALMFAYVILLNNAEKRIRINNSRNIGTVMSGAAQHHMPIKLNIGGVMPVIFASSVMNLPAIIAMLFGVDSNSVIGKIVACFNQTNWFRLDHPIYSIGAILFIALIYMFWRFYVMISFNTLEIANNLKKNGTIVNGIRPGAPTAEYLDKQVNSMLWLGTTMLMIVALVPMILSGLFGISGLSFGGTTIIIIVGVLLDMRTTIEADTSVVTYKKLIHDGGKKR